MSQQRRMMSPKIIDSDAFLEMPQTCQNLYFHLTMRGDDDGFVGNPKKIMRMLGNSDDDLRLLITKRFVLIFESGVIVIKHWLVHNQIRADRYHPTEYKIEKNTLYLNENGAYTERDTGHRLPSWQPNGNQMDTEVRLGKVRLGKNKNNKISKADRLNGQYDLLFENFWREYPNKTAKGKAYEVWSLLSDDLKIVVQEAIENQNKNNHFWKDWINDGVGGDSPPHATTWLNQKRWEDEVKFIEKKGRTNNSQNYTVERKIYQD